MKAKTTLADKYLFANFFETCSQESKDSICCCGVELVDEAYSWLDVAIDGGTKCGKCQFRVERLGVYYGKGSFSQGFEAQEYISLNNIRSQEEFEMVCDKINQNAKGITVRGAVTDATPFSRFEKLEFVMLSNQKIARFWDMSKNPQLRILSVYINKHLKSLEGLENAAGLACVQFIPHISSTDTVKIESLAPLSKLPNLKEVILSAIEPLDHNMDNLINVDRLEYLWISPNLFPLESYAKFETKKFMISDAYGIFLEIEEDIYPYGKGKRVMHTQDQKEKYLDTYYKLMDTYR